MNITALLSTLGAMVAMYFPEEMDPSLKPKDSADCVNCRKIVYDFIIVGAGSAGSVLANRLSANPEWNVLLIEAGGDEDYVTDAPAMTAVLAGTRYDWNYTTVKQHRACYSSKGICRYPAGHVMGGTSTINGMDYVRGNKKDYDEWASLGNPGWSYNEVLPYFLKAENMTVAELAKDTRYHSINGPQTVGYSKYHTQISDDFIKAVTESGVHQVDYNGATQIGVADLQFTMRGPTRCSTSKAYLNPIRERTNLYIFKNTEAKKILINSNTRKAEGVLCSTNGKEYNVYAKKEVVLSAGVFNTPKLLMLSGIGPKEHLEKHQIPLLANLPVGENFVDHSGVSLRFSVNQTALNCCTEYTADTILEYARDRQGPLAAPSQQTLSFLNLINNQRSVPEVTIIMGVVSGQFTGGKGPQIFVYIGNISPKSTGTVKLNSNNWSDQPLIDPNYFGIKSDMAAVRRGIRYVLHYLAKPSMAKYSLKWLRDEASMCNYTYPITDEYLECFITNTAIAGYHGVGTARMGSPLLKTTVVDGNLRVHTINGLRVVDASIMPRITRGNTMAPVVMAAEKASDIILNHYGVDQSKF